MNVSFAPSASIRRVALLSLVFVAQTVGSGNDSAWNLLLDNRPFEAREEFTRNATHADKKVAGEALHGLARVAWFLGEEQEAARRILEAFRADGDTVAFMASRLAWIPFSRQWGGQSLKPGYEVLRDFDRRPSLITGALSAELAARYTNDGDLRKAGEIHARSGQVRDWWAIGPFSNVSGSGFDKKYPPEMRVALDSAHEGKNGNKVTWFPLSIPSPSSWLFIQNHLPAANAVLYFAAGVESPSERRAVLGFGASGSFKVFVNGKLVLAERVFRNTGEDAFQAEVTLRKGPNLVLVKLGNEDKYSNFLLRFTDEAGRGMTDLAVRKPAGDAYNGAADMGEEPDLRRSPVIDAVTRALHQRLAADAGDDFAAIMLMETYVFAEMTDSAEALAERRIALRPGSALWHVWRAEALTRGGQVTAAQEALKTAHRLSPLSHQGWGYEMGRLQQSAGSEAMLDFLTRSPEAFRKSSEGRIVRTAHLAQLGRNAEALEEFAALEKITDRYNVQAAGFLARVYKAQGRTAEAVQAWKRLIRHENSNVQARLELADLQIQLGDLRGAQATLAEARRFAPENPNIPFKLANIHIAQKRYTEAAAALTQAEASAPTNEVLLGARANLLVLMERKEDARRALVRSTEYTYNDFASLDRLRELDGLPGFEALAPLPPVDSLLQAARDWPGLTGEKRSVLSHVQDVFFYANRASRQRHFMVFYLPSQEAVTNATRFDIPYNGTYQELNVTRALTRKRAGAEVDAEVNGNTVVFKSAEPGDLVVLEWALKDNYDGAMARQVWGQFHFRRDVSVFDARLRLHEAGGDTIGHEARGAGILVETREAHGVRTRVFSESPHAVKPDEQHVPDNDATRPDVLYSTFDHWGRIADWYADLTENKSDASHGLRRLADSLFRGATSDSEKVARVHRFVSSSIAYSSLSFRQSGWVPQDAREVLGSRLGDCKDKAALAKSLLELAGIRSRLVLVATRNEFATRPGPVGPHFNHCILAYVLNGKERYMELTDTELHWSGLSKYDQGALALVAEKGRRDLFRLPLDSASARLTSRALKYELGEDGDAVVTSRVVRYGIAANGTRASYRSASPAERSAAMRRAVSDVHTDVVMDTLWFGEMDPAADSVPYGYTYRARRAVQAQGKTRIYSLDLHDRLNASDVPGAEEAVSGLNLYPAWYSVGSFEQTGTIKVPAGWKPLDLPEPITLKTPYGDYSLVFQARPDGLAYTRRAVFRLGRDVPAAQGPAVQSFLSTVARADNVQLIFIKP